MALTPEIVTEILQQYKLTRSPFKVSTKVGVSIGEVFEVIENYEDRLATVPERHGGGGRPELRPYIVAKRKASDSSWENSNDAIKLARANYEAGTHIMVTGRDGGWLIMYSIPRKGRRDPLPEYFQPEVA